MGKFTEKHKKGIGILAIAVYILFALAIFWYIGRPMLRFVGEPEAFRDWVSAHGVWGKITFVGMMTLQIVIAFIPGEPLEIGAGYAFGIWEGTALCLIGCVVGSALVFLLVRYFGVKLVEVFFPVKKIRSLKFLQNTKKLNLLTFIVYFIPGTPKDMLAYFIGLTDMKLSTWLIITLFARIPSVVTSTVGGNALGLEKYQFAAVVFAVTIAISIAGIIIYNRIAGSEKEKSGGNSITD